MLKYQIKSFCCRLILVLCWLMPAAGCEMAFINFGTYLLICLSSLIVGFFAYNGFIHADRKVFRMRRKKIIQLCTYHSTENKQVA